MARLLCHLVHKPMFFRLRTKEQLGYAVTGATHGLLVKMQFPRLPWVVEGRVDTFLAGCRDTLGVRSGRWSTQATAMSADIHPFLSNRTLLAAAHSRHEH
ncbi:uncharacterized protein BXZ73DRAFT_104174 [Epithele typhae]|uniref:uncharacterized protein n=1 Tax=Epithele typhae TaxID=378194 RepID=UPI002007FEA8|nr:uncharacterized protein BXZ73DRAFT_104174 [Epithele typhae]KAH9922351.1 hypothetical protein BXZ73DRAFT_104174 [Epithele typhae]